MMNLDSLIVAAKDGDRVAQNELFARYRSLLRLIAAQVVDIAVCHREDASDVVQLTEMEAYRSLNAFRGSTAGEFAAWMKQILRRNAANLLRDHRAGKRDGGARAKDRDLQSHDRCAERDVAYERPFAAKFAARFDGNTMVHLAGLGVFAPSCALLRSVGDLFGRRTVARVSFRRANRGWSG